MNFVKLLSTAIALHILVFSASALSIGWLGYVRGENSAECEFIHGSGARTYGRLSEDELVKKYSSDDVHYHILLFVQPGISIIELETAIIALSRTKINSVFVMVSDGVRSPSRSRYGLYVDLNKSGDKYPHKLPYDNPFNTTPTESLDGSREEIEAVIEIETPSTRHRGGQDPLGDGLLPPPKSDPF
jgi:hypothetical protein